MENIPAGNQFSFWVEDGLFIFLILILFILLYLIWKSRQQKNVQSASQKQVELIKEGFELSEDCILVLSPKLEVVYANKAMEKFLRLGEEYLFASFAVELKFKPKKEWVRFEQLLKEDSPQRGSTLRRYPNITMSIGDNKDEILVNLYFDISTSADQDHLAWKYMVILHDLRMKEAYKVSEYRHQITKLPNQAQAIEDMNAFYSRSHLSHNKLAVIAISIDQFSEIRSMVGYHQLNKIMIKLAKYMKDLANKREVEVYHAYENNFLLIVPEVFDDEEVNRLVDKIQNDLKAFYKVQDINLQLSTSVGISFYPDGNVGRNQLNNAYKALSKAQSLGMGRREYFSSVGGKFVFDEIKLYQEMPDALSNREFEVFYQPIVDAKTHEIVSAEALIRWIHPKLGMIPPYVFIPLMEKTGFIIELGRYILDEVLRQLKRWEIFRFKPITVSINMTMIEIESGNFVDEVRQKIAYAQVNPKLLKFEITEGSAMNGEANTIAQFHRLKELGVGISLDDFGTGYTSFSYLKKFPADVLKIDKSLVDYILTEEDDRKIVQAMILLAHSLQMKVVVEGIENRDMADLLTVFGCDYFQGYYFAKPLPLFEIQGMLRQQSQKMGH